MYRSLYRIIRPKVEAKETGILKILHAGNQDGAIKLDNGAMTGFIQGKSAGVEAAKIIFHWINLAAIYSPDESITFPDQKRLNNDKVLDQLKKIDDRVSLFIEQIGGCDAVFQFIGQQISGAQHFSQQELSISFLLDGKTAMNEVQRQCGLSELDLLISVIKLIKTGLVKQIHPHQQMASEEYSAFLEQLEDVLSDITGPVASVIINDALAAIGATHGMLARCDLPLLCSVIAYHLEDDESNAFNQWVEAFDKKN